jgi:hypothetical protein
MERSRERPVIQAALAGSALMLLWMGRRIALGELSEMFADRWVATIDGRPAPVEEVNGDCLGCVVPAGAHRVAFEFVTPAFI